MLSERLQLVLSPEQRQLLEREARRRRVSVASLIREAIDARFAAPTREDRLRAVDEIAAMGGEPLPSLAELERIVAEERESAAAPSSESAA